MRPSPPWFTARCSDAELVIGLSRNAFIMTGREVGLVNQRTSKSPNGLGRFYPREPHRHFLRGSQLDRSTLRQEFERRHQAWPRSGLAHLGPTTPKPIEPN